MRGANSSSVTIAAAPSTPPSPSSLERCTTSSRVASGRHAKLAIGYLLGLRAGPEVHAVSHANDEETVFESQLEEVAG